MKSRIGPLALLYLFCQSAHAQQFVAVESLSATWKCHGWVWVGYSNLYCSDARSHDLSKTSRSGQVMFSSLEATTAGPPRPTLAMDVDTAGTLYVVDGKSIHLYTSDGKYRRTLTPGVNLSVGIAVLDAEHIFVSGRTIPTKEPSGNTIFLIGPSGIEKGFSDVFVKGLSGIEDIVMNSASYLALDRSRKLLYQVSQQVYEIRVFDLQGNLQKTITPPSEYQTRTPQIEQFGNAAGLAPSDTISDIVALPDGGFAIDGDTLDFARTEGKKTAVSYTRFVDIYNASGNFHHRLTGAELQLSGAHFLGFDHSSGQAFFKDDRTVLAAALR